MYIEPNTNIRLLSNVPLDSDYEHTLYWESALAQSTYFSSKTKHNVLDSQFQRVTTGVMKVGYKSDSLYDCNYMMFQNSSFGSKWFYAFIKNVEYINNVTSKIEFEIDVVQTWWFEAILEQSYVEREHVASDNLFENLQPEPTGSYDYIDIPLFVSNDNKYNAVVLSATTPDGQNPPSPRYVNGVYNPLETKVFNMETELDDLTDYIKSFYNSGGLDNIVSIFQAPYVLGDGETRLSVETEVAGFEDDIDGYAPRNNKMFTYPYVYLEASNHLGETVDYQLENFGDSDLSETGFVKFITTGTIIPNPAMIVYPKKYRNRSNAFDYGITYTQFPQLPWISDTAKAYMAQHAYSYATGISGDVMRFGVGAGVAALGVATLNPAIALAGVSQSLGAGTNIAGTLAKTMDLKNAPDKVSNMSSNDSLNIATSNCNITIYRKELKYQFAKMIDDYFTMFGYAVNKLKVPHRRNRQSYTYIKTRNCNITGGLPSDDKRKLMSIYDKGITFWVDPDDVGDYSVDNHTIG